MVVKIKKKIDELLQHNQYVINDTDYAKLQAYINLLYHFAQNKNYKAETDE